MPEHRNSSYACFYPPTTNTRIIQIPVPNPITDISIATSTLSGTGNFQFIITNTTNIAAENVLVRIDLSQNIGASYNLGNIIVSQGTFFGSPNEIIWNVGTLNGGDNATITVSQNLGFSSATSIGSVWTSTTEANYLNNTAVFVAPGNTTDLSIGADILGFTGDTGPIGSIIFNVFNTTGVTADNVFMRIFTPPVGQGFTITSMAAPQGSITFVGNIIDWTIGTISPNTVVSIFIGITRNTTNPVLQLQFIGTAWTTTPELFFPNNSFVATISTLPID